MSATITGTPGVAASEAARISRDVTAERWSARRTIAFIVLFCGGFWIGVAALVSALFRAL